MKKAIVLLLFLVYPLFATDYYIDYDNGNDGNTGLSTGQSWKTITKYTTDTVRSAGDRAFLRAGITWDQGTEAKDITFDEDGTIDAYISLIGCDSVTNDPWSDASDVKPIIDFENLAYQMVLSGDNYWWLERLDFRQSNDTSGMLNIVSCDYNYVKNCNFQDNNSSGVEGLLINASEYATVDGCTFLDCFGSALNILTSNVSVKSCTFTAGVDVSTDYGIRMDNGSRACIQDVVFSGSFDADDIRMEQNSIAWVRNVDWSGSGVSITESSSIYSEDDNATFESHISYFGEGTITRDTGTVRSGGADSSAKMESTSLCGPNRPLKLGDDCSGFRPIWKAAGSYTATVYVRVGTAWDSALTASECYMVTSELDNAATAARVERTSTETINNAGTWTALTTSVSPEREGFIYLWVYLAEYEDATEHIFVDVLPVIQ